MSDLGILQKPIPFGKYYLLEKVNTGGMAEVFKAKAFGVEGFERVLAIKRILPSIAEDEEFITMFIDEAKISVQLNHANIAQISELGKINDDYFIAMEYVSGRDLRGIFDRAVKLNEKLSVPQVCYVIMRLCEGMDYAHNKRNEQGQELGIIHRDVSPQNVLISFEGEVKLIDFGIAKAHGKGSQTQVGILKGKFSYMSPEQVRGGRLDRRSDIFSLGIVLYEMLTLKRLFLGSSDFSTLEKIRKVEISPPTLFDPQIPQELEDIVLKSLARDVNERYQSAHEMQEAIHRFMFNQGLYFTNKDLASFMKSAFATEIKFEQKKLEYYSTLKKEDLERSRRSSGGSLEWEEEEGETNVYDKEPDAAVGKAKNKKEVLAALDKIELPAGDEIVYAAPKGAGGQPMADDMDAPTLSMSTLDHLSLPSAEPVFGSAPAPKPSRTWESAAAAPRHTHQALPPAPPPQAATGGSGKTALIVVLILLLLGGGGVAAWLLTRDSGGGSGEKKEATGEQVVETGVIEFDFHKDTRELINERHLSGNVSITIKDDNDKVLNSLKGVTLSVQPAPIAGLPLKANLKFEVEMDGFESIKSPFFLNGKETKKVELRFNPERINLVVKVPDGASVTLDGEPIPGASGTFKLDNLEPRAARIVVSKDGFLPYEQLVDLSNLSEETPLEIKTDQLVPLIALVLKSNVESDVIIEVMDNDDNAKVVNGKPLANAPFRNLNPTHKYTIKGSHPKHGEATASWTPTKGDTEGTVELAFEVKSSSNGGGGHRRRPPREENGGSSGGGSDPKPTKGPPGILQVNSRPAAEVFINGKNKGMTSKKLTLPPGTYTVKLYAADKGVNVSKQVTIDSGQVVKCAGSTSGLRCR